MMSNSLVGLRLLLVEDEALVLMSLQDVLTEWGCDVVGTAPSLSQAMSLLDETAIDAAVLDVNLNGEPVFPLAERLAERGLPFVLSTGYDQRGMPPAFRDRPIVQKPYEEGSLRAALLQAIKPGRGT